MSDIQMNCIICNKPNKPQCKTCSRECGILLKKKNTYEERKCIQCEKIFIERKKVKRTLCSDDCRKEWALKPENKKIRLENSQQAVMKIHGVKSTFLLDNIKEKIKKTKQEKYGDEYYVNHEKRKKTLNERYGVDNSMFLEESKNKIKSSKKEKYGDENYNNRAKANSTSLETYGTKFPIQLDEFKEKRKNTNLQNYGVEHPMQNKEVRDKTNKTVLNRYGVDNVSQNNSIKEKVKNTYYNKFPQSVIMAKLQNNNLELLSDYIGLREGTIYKPYLFKCIICKTEFNGTFTNHRPPVCRVCYPMYKNNKMQQEFRDFLNEVLPPNSFFENERQIIKPYELDFYIPIHSLSIELNGNYYHSEIGGEKLRDYHLNKTKLCYDKKIRLIHIFEDEWMFKKDIIKSKIKNILKIKPQTFFARKCIINPVNFNDKKIFLEQNHLQGNTVDEIRLGLFYNNELISLITFLKLRKWMGDRKEESNSWELSRFCNKVGLNIPGGFSKLLQYFIKTYNPNMILTFADCRWSSLDYNNTVYIKNNFKFIKYTPPSYYYFKKGDYLTRFHRYTFNKKKLLKLIPENSLNNINYYTEWELAQFLKMDRIWDCGNIRFEMLPNKKGENF